ncbi:unnamed protein product [Dimorphilus gyrociliatus]|uniref:Uncharacterized protein n=1 Tax=Dimorphilus gyrociliatus TaxID=2664684 RepID=A0A7I8W516_9ANNE|nr:unnamed protein product [Dimorphilus gyrociliatus]
MASTSRIPPVTITPPPLFNYSSEDEDDKETGRTAINTSEGYKDLLTVPQPAFLMKRLSQSTDEDEDGDVFLFSCCEKTKLCTVTLYLWLTLLAIGSAISLAVIGVLLVEPWRKASSFIKTQCTSTEYVSQDRKCTCGKSCSSVYPCLIVTVRYKDQELRDHLVRIKENESILNKEVSILQSK